MQHPATTGYARDDKSSTAPPKGPAPQVHGKEGGQRFEYVRGLRKGLHMPERNRVGVPVAGVRRLAVGRRSPTVLLLEHDARGCVAA
jgi:hypothetical protein